MSNFSVVGKWMCCWHHCDHCGRNATKLCSQCPNSYCNQHLNGNIFRLESGHFVCEDHTGVLQSSSYTQVEANTAMRVDVYSVHSDQHSDTTSQLSDTTSQLSDTTSQLSDTISQLSDCDSVASSRVSCNSVTISKSTNKLSTSSLTYDNVSAMSNASVKSKSGKVTKQKLLTDFVSPEKRQENLPSIGNILKETFASPVSKENIFHKKLSSSDKVVPQSKKMKATVIVEPKKKRKSKTPQKLANGVPPKNKRHSSGKVVKNKSASILQNDFEEGIELVIDM